METKQVECIDFGGGVVLPRPPQPVLEAMIATNKALREYVKIADQVRAHHAALSSLNNELKRASDHLEAMQNKSIEAITSWDLPKEERKES